MIHLSVTDILELIHFKYIYHNRGDKKEISLWLGLSGQNLSAQLKQLEEAVGERR